MPLAPLGCAVQMYEAPTKQRTWAENSIDGWYIQTSPKHYRCHVIYKKNTKSMRISDTVWFKHKYITQPIVTPAVMIVKALTDLTQALKGRTNLNRLEQIESLKCLKELLTNTPPSSPTHTVEPREENPKQTTLDTTELKVETPTITFDTKTKPPNNTAYTSPKLNQPEPRVQKKRSKGINKAIINKPMPPDKNQLTKIQ